MANDPLVGLRFLKFISDLLPMEIDLLTQPLNYQTNLLVSHFDAV